MTTPLTDEQLAEIEARRKAASEMVSALCERKRQWVMSIPARRDYDPDLVIGDSLQDIPALLAEVRRLREENELLRAEREGVFLYNSDLVKP